MASFSSTVSFHVIEAGSLLEVLRSIGITDMCHFIWVLAIELRPL